MSAQERIAAVLKAHIEREPFRSPPSCHCGWVNHQYGINDSTEHTGHVAGVVLAAIGIQHLDAEDLWDAQQCVQDWRDCDNADDSPYYRQRWTDLAKRLRDVANDIHLAGTPIPAEEQP